MRLILQYTCAALLFLNAACRDYQSESSEDLTVELYSIVDNVPGTVGVAFVSNDDTITINNGVHYPMMSVFKLHQALAVAAEIEQTGSSIDSSLTVTPSELDYDTWSPMLKQYGATDFKISVKELIEYALVSSDNNASNILFNKIITPEDTEKFVKSIAEDTNFRIIYTESEMKRNHVLSYANFSTPLSAAILIKKVFTSEILNSENQDVIKSALCKVTTGQDRLGASVADQKGVLFAHKTGSGYRNECGELMAHNDVGYFRLPDGRDYGLAVMIRDFNGSEAEASAIIAEISRTVYNYFVQRSMP